MKEESDEATPKTEITMSLVRRAFYEDLVAFERKLHSYKKLIKVIRQKNTR